ncbi:MAG: chalcone isomerase family protein [Acidobacteria bacterium]|nr:chalcone isomerase family protein [Acidobacteriota bacterium]
MRTARFVLSVLVAAAPVVAGELAGVRLPDTLSMSGKTLRLNGMGLRKKAIFKVYVGGLYLETPSKNAAAILAADSPKAVTMHFLRDIEKEKLVAAYQEGFEANAKAQAAAQKNNVDKFLGLVTQVKEGSQFTVAYVPGAGTTVLRDGKAAGTFEGKAFADVVFALWLGPHPPTADLQKGMLGN